LSSTWEEASEQGEAVEQAKQEVKTIDTMFKKPKVQPLGLKVASYGPEEVGKSYFALTFPPPIYVINFEPNGIVRLLHLFPDKDIRECPTWEGWIGKGQEDDVTIAVESIKALEEAINVLSGVTEGTIVVDSVTHIWRYAEVWMKRVKVPELARRSGNKVFEFDWAYAYALTRRLMLKLLVRPVHLVLTGQTKDEYVAEKPTGKWIARWMTETPHMVDVVIRMEKRKTVTTVNNVPTTKIKYISIIEKVRGEDRKVKKLKKPIEIEDLTFDKLVKALTEELKIPREVLGLERD